jgi:hypothetical protein
MELLSKVSKLIFFKLFEWFGSRISDDLPALPVLLAEEDFLLLVEIVRLIQGDIPQMLLHASRV